jgi:hypothetical protein
MEEVDETENFVSPTKDTKFIDYQNAQIILNGLGSSPICLQFKKIVETCIYSSDLGKMKDLH